MKNSSNKVLYLAQAAMIAAIYVVLTVVGASLAFGEVQIRFAEALTMVKIIGIGLIFAAIAVLNIRRA